MIKLLLIIMISPLLLTMGLVILVGISIIASKLTYRIRFGEW